MGCTKLESPGKWNSVGLGAGIDLHDSMWSLTSGGMLSRLGACGLAVAALIWSCPSPIIGLLCGVSLLLLSTRGLPLTCDTCPSHSVQAPLSYGFGIEIAWIAMLLEGYCGYIFVLDIDKSRGV